MNRFILIHLYVEIFQGSNCTATSQAEFSLEFTQYYDPGERNYNGGKCDTFSSCNYYFIICLNTKTDQDPCTIGKYTTKYWDASENLAFTVGQEMSDGGAKNPLGFSIQSYSVSKYIHFRYLIR